ncbi:MAG: hypothetical protein QHH06_08990 [Clostridiales bacterium]|nr:hypothetical protein [Eubacteriales bacterium]MDH7566601.1 hypothetical protein [Clostridiales bacterium]
MITIDGMKFYSMEYRHGKPSFGPVNLSKALAVSDNIYFQTVGVKEPEYPVQETDRILCTG